MADEVRDQRPPPPDWLNKDFVQRALRSGDQDSSLTVVSCEARMANAVGDGYASDMYRVTARLADGSTRAVIVKCHPQGGKMEEVVSSADFFAIELKMLKDTLPAMSKLLEEARPGQYSPFSARLLYDGDEPVKFLVLEDLRQEGFTLAKRQQGVDLEHCTMVMRTMARFHAASIALHDRTPEAIECYDKNLYCEGIRGPFEVFVKGSVRSVANEVQTWPTYKEKYSEKLLKLSDTIFEQLIEVYRPKDGGYNSLIHSDLWISNMMFRYTDKGVADMRLVDFQIAHYTSPALDIHYFMSTCPDENVREHHVQKLLQDYRGTLNQTLDELGCSKYQMSMEDLTKELTEREFFVVFASLIILPAVLSDPKDGFDVEKSMSANEADLKSNKGVYAGELYTKVLKQLLPIFDDKGLI